MHAKPITLPIAVQDPGFTIVAYRRVNSPWDETSRECWDVAVRPAGAVDMGGGYNGHWAVSEEAAERLRAIHAGAQQTDPRDVSSLTVSTPAISAERTPSGNWKVNWYGTNGTTEEAYAMSVLLQGACFLQSSPERNDGYAEAEAEYAARLAARPSISKKTT